MYSKLLSAVACNLDSNILQASLPLLKNEKIEAIEWSFDSLYKTPDIPSWFTELLHVFSNENQLTGHGVYFSLFSGKWTSEQAAWLMRLEKISSAFRFDHISEHFGFMTGENFHNGAPLSIPYTKKTLEIGIDRLKRIYNACHCPVGLENLAFSYSLEEVKKHGAFLNELVEPVNGFIILDVHNLFCQLKNFDVDLNDLVKAYPLHRVREIHVSGGSWEHSLIAPERKVRRDTHDDFVPQEVFNLLEKCIPLCENLKYVVLEQIGTGLQTEESREQFQRDFLKLRAFVEEANKRRSAPLINNFLPVNAFEPRPPIEDLLLQQQQSELSDILENATDYHQAKNLLANSALVNTASEIEKWQPFMLETAINIAQKWKNGFKG